ncbi:MULTISPECIES: alpha/beta fold hydrolase [Brevibacterium]|uniref:3-oxoadipate enol-lactone hydrolase/4-carboxymuconolactone decarboxylase n=2 Tax=Brevibacterium casei TaxID=33889 RepID=K9APV0_9MICO|nr:alpha/beta fold hydrolase [Brevibacterium casei]NJE68049.1 alpha/beta fold hydrolase [Brevibacterium sp. LS14]SII43505.1 4-carboxymuconolactone decarboxylase [Mycobacteroides abscessus subsp. abscessus]EKU49408.1 3-oxoadipate enol-lactone hydrolase/4-carboxymuconolactone decarboxylase [Brevibacterium casei S18]KZE09923.1 3-oxoadipate enol-lactone hydrolase [Brevibacterium casei]MBE4694687.1 alpha/beta fold hydrolase [Brevibacterium casei]
MRIALHAFNDNPGSPVLVFGDALGTRVSLWAAVASRLVDDHQIYLSDLPGHTFPVSKEELSTDFTISDLAAGLVQSLEDHGVESFTYCGASISGGIGLTLALEHPQKLTGLIACSTATKFGTDVSWAERITEVENDGTQSLLPDTADRWFAAGFLEEDIATGPATLTDLATIDDAAYIACCRALALYDLTGKLGAITTPTLFLAGSQDPGCTPEAMGEMRDAVDGSELAVVPDSAHLLMAEHPEIVADRIHSFLASR